MEGVLNLLQHNFSLLDVELHAESGQRTESNCDDKIVEAFKQMGIEVD